MKKLIILIGIIFLFINCSGKIINLGVLRDANKDMIKEIAKAIEKETGHIVMINEEISGITSGETDLLNGSVDVVMTFNSENLDMANNSIRNLNKDNYFGKSDRPELVNLGPVYSNHSVLFSKYKSADEIPDNTLIVIDIDSDSLKNALRILEQENMISYNHDVMNRYYPSSIEMFQYTDKIIAENGKKFSFAIYEPRKRRITKIFSDGVMSNYGGTQDVKKIFDEGGMLLFDNFDYTEQGTFNTTNLLSLFTKYDKLAFIEDKGYTFKLREPLKGRTMVLAMRDNLKDKKKIEDFVKALKSESVKKVFEKYSKTVSPAF